MRRRPRCVIDTNVLVSALLWKGTPGRLIDLAGEHELQLCTSRALLDELIATLCKKKLVNAVSATGLSREQMLQNYRRVATLVTVPPLAHRVSRDIDDDAVLACAMAARADLLVSGDNDLLVLGSFAGIPIVSAGQALRMLAKV